MRGTKVRPNDESRRKDSLPAAEKVKTVSANPAHLAKARRFDARAREGAKAEPTAVAGK
jgi:hypothetical protein